MTGPPRNGEGNHAEHGGGVPPAADADHGLSPEDRAAALAEEREAIRLDAQTIGVAWVFALVPLGLLLIMAQALLGEWVWALLPVAFLGIVAALKLMPLRHRYANELPLELPDATRLHGERKRRFLLKAALIAAALFVGEMLFRMYGGRLWEWTVPWGW